MQPSLKFGQLYMFVWVYFTEGFVLLSIRKM